MLIQSRLHVISSADAFRRKFRCWHDWLQASRRQRSALSFQRNRNCGRWCPIGGGNCAHKRLIRNFCPVGQYDFTSSLLAHSCPAHYYAAPRSKMRPIVTGDPWSVCLCVRHKCKLWKRLNRSRRRLEEADLWGPKEPCMGFTLAPTGEYDWTIPECGGDANYLDHLLFLLYTRYSNRM